MSLRILAFGFLEYEGCFDRGNVVEIWRRGHSRICNGVNRVDCRSNGCDKRMRSAIFFPLRYLVSWTRPSPSGDLQLSSQLHD